MTSDTALAAIAPCRVSRFVRPCNLWSNPFCNYFHFSFSGSQEALIERWGNDQCLSLWLKKFPLLYLILRIMPVPGQRGERGRR